MKHEKFVELNNIIAGFVPVDMQTAANNGDWVSLKNYNRMLAVVFKAAGTAGDDPVITLQQATAVDGTGAKALNFTEIWTKVGAQTGIGQFTKNTQSAANTYTDPTSAEAQMIAVIEILPEMLDVANDFDCVQISVPDVGGNAQLGCAFYIMLDAKHGADLAPSAIAD